MNRRLAHWTSVVLHPVLMPTYALWILLNYNTYLKYTTTAIEQLVLFAIVIVNNLLAPLIITYILIRRGWIRSFEMDTKEERLIPFAANAALLLTSYYLMEQLLLPKVYSLLLLGAAVSVVLAILINLKWKISIHMIGIGGMTGILFGLSTFLFVDLRMPVIFCLLTAGVLGTARLTLDAHTPAQLYARFGVGFASEFLLLAL